MNKIRKKKWYFWFVMLVIVVTLLPYLYGYSIETEQKKFSGFFIGVADQNSYIAKMRKGYEGDWLFWTPYSAYPQNGTMMYMPYILIGKLAGGDELNGQFQFLYQLLRIASIGLYVYALKRIYSRYIQSSGLVKLAIVLCVFGGGFGWLYFLGLSGLWQNRLPLEFYSPEAFSLLAVLTLPHIIIGRAFMILALDTWIHKQSLQIRTINVHYAIMCAFYGFLVFLFQPITFGILLILLTVHLVVESLSQYFSMDRTIQLTWQKIKPSWGAYLLCIMLLFPVIAYTIYISLCDPFVVAWSKQNILYSPPITDYFLAYSGILLLAMIGFRKGRISESKNMLFYWLWISIGIIMIYIPVSIQRRFIEGAWVAFVLLGVKGIERIEAEKIKTIILRIAISVFMMSFLFIITGSMIQVKSMQSPMFIENEKLSMFDSLENMLEAGDTVFASHEISNEIPVWTSLNTIVGLGPESIGEKEILQIYYDVLAGKEEPEKLFGIFSESDVKAYIIENQYLNLFSKCEIIYSSANYTVCKVP